MAGEIIKSLIEMMTDFSDPQQIENTMEALETEPHSPGVLDRLLQLAGTLLSMKILADPIIAVGKWEKRSRPLKK